MELTYIFVALQSPRCDAPEMLTEATWHDFDHSNEGSKVDCPCREKEY